ncbi:MAG TPA: ATP-binding protein [Candidatus Acidoferrales bacterium]|nr:ATP-binding protein [Candidatus Acidoferrales bacterium]
MGDPSLHPRLALVLDTPRRGGIVVAAASPPGRDRRLRRRRGLRRIRDPHRDAGGARRLAATPRIHRRRHDRCRPHDPRRRPGHRRSGPRPHDAAPRARRGLCLPRRLRPARDPARQLAGAGGVSLHPDRGPCGRGARPRCGPLRARARHRRRSWHGLRGHRALGRRARGIQVLDLPRRHGRPKARRDDAAEAFTQQRPTIANESTSGRTIPEGYRLHKSHQVLAAPITVGEHRFGVISTIADRSSLFFFEDDLALLALLADQTAVVLENRRLFDVIDGLNATLEQRVIELRVLNSELSAFAYSVSHDLRAPLRSIDGFSQILLEDHSEQLGDEGRRVLARIRAGAVQLGQLIDDLLALSRVTRDEMSVADVDLGQIAEAIVAELRQREPGRAMEYSSVRSPIARGDPRLLKVALTNLLENAWKFTRGRAPAHVRFAGEEKDGEVVFHISDDGAGFDMRYADKLFGAFQRLHTQADFEGTGIGLATVQRIMHRHGGRIWASAEPGKGATFFFSLPIAQGAARTEV